MADPLAAIYDMLESGKVRGTVFRSPNDASIIAQPHPFPELEEIGDKIVGGLWWLEPLPRARWYANRVFGWDLPETGCWAPPDKGAKLLHPLKWASRIAVPGKRGRFRAPPIVPITPEAVSAVLADVRRDGHAYNVPLSMIHARLMNRFGCCKSDALVAWSAHRVTIAKPKGAVK